MTLHKIMKIKSLLGHLTHSKLSVSYNNNLLILQRMRWLDGITIYGHEFEKTLVKDREPMLQSMGLQRI